VTDSSDEVAESSQINQAQRAEAIRRLLAIKEALEEKRERIRNLVVQRAAADETESEFLFNSAADDLPRYW